MRGFRVWSDYWKKYATEAELYMDGSVDAMFEDGDGVPHHENTDLVLENDDREEIICFQYNQQNDYEVIGNIHEN